MKDFYSGNFNLESRLVQKGVLDLKAFWQFIDDKYFRDPEGKSLDPVNHITQILIKNSELPIVEKKDLKDPHNSPKFVEELRMETVKISNLLYAPNPVVYKVFGVNLSVNKLGNTEVLIGNMLKCAKENNKNNLTKINVDGLKSAKSLECPSTGLANNVKDEISLIEGILQNDFYELNFKKALDSRLNEEFILNNDQRQILLKNLESQIISLEFAQYAESVTKIESHKKNKNYLRLSCDSADKLPSINVSETNYKYLFKFRDSSNFLFSLDKTHPHSHIFINDKRKENLSKEKTEKKIVLKKEDVKVDFNLCHNCKMRKPTELMVQCKNKDSIRQVKFFNLFNMSVIRKLEKFFIVPNFTGDFRDLLNSLIPKHSVPLLSSINQKCGRYFCNYCLKGSYQINIDSLTKPAEISINSQGVSQASTCNSSESEKEKSKDKSKSKNILKDWCCPWCLNDCFCSRCLREEQILKLVTIFFYYEGDLQDLLINILSYHPILKALRNQIVLSNLEIKDFSFQERQCKNSKGVGSNLNGTEASEVIEGGNKKHIRLSKKGKFESSKNKKNSKTSKLIKSKSVDKVDIVNLEYKVQQLDELIQTCQTEKEEYRKIQKVLSEKLISKPILNKNKISIINSAYFERKSVGRPKKSSSKSINSIALNSTEENSCKIINTYNITKNGKSRSKLKSGCKKYKKVVEDGQRIIKALGTINLLRRKRKSRRLNGNN